MTILGIITIITGITFLLNAYVFYVRFMQRKENCSKQIVVLVINYKRKTYRSFDNPTPTYFFFPLYQFKTRKREYKIQSKLGRRIKPEKGEYIEIFVNPKNPTELYEPADNFFSEDYINSEWVTIKNLTIGGTLLMFMSIVTGYCSVRPEIPIYLGNIMKIYAIVSGMGFIISLAMAALDIIICTLEFVNNLRLKLQAEGEHKNGR